MGTAMREVSFMITKDDRALVRQIVDRFAEAASDLGDQRDLDELRAVSMDLVACHANGCPMDFQRLLDAPDFDFFHDIDGIQRHIDRATGELGDCFLPRTAKPSRAEA